MAPVSMEGTAFWCQGMYPIKITLATNWLLGDKFMLSRRRARAAVTAKVTAVAGHLQTLFNVVFRRGRMAGHAETFPHGIQ